MADDRKKRIPEPRPITRVAAYIREGRYRDAAREMLGLPTEAPIAGESRRQWSRRQREKEAEVFAADQLAEARDQYAQNKLAAALLRESLTTRRCLFPEDSL